jgi:hypothetical protein
MQFSERPKKMSEIHDHQSRNFSQWISDLGQCTLCNTTASGNIFVPEAFPLFQNEPSMPCRVLSVL